jgi:hypothetical protein
MSAAGPLQGGAAADGCRYTGAMRHAATALLLALALLLDQAGALAAPAPNTPPPPAADAPPPDWFEVELIVFRHTGPDQSVTESWPDAPGRPAVDTALDMEPTGVEPIPFMALPTDKSRLAKEWDALRRSARFKPLAYYAWVQPPFDRTSAPALRIASPAPPPPAPGTANAEPPAPPFGATLNVPLPTVPTLPPLRTPLDGTATLGLQRYLYLTLDLVLLPEPLPPDLAARPEGTTFGGFRLTETRRMRSKELHYFDHPVFGVVALVTPRPAPGAAAAKPPARAP